MLNSNQMVVLKTLLLKIFLAVLPLMISRILRAAPSALLMKFLIGGENWENSRPPLICL